ncbi:hypothetical protein J3F84DRAFT_356012 [Trichoderma pleuroticola]
MTDTVCCLSSFWAVSLAKRTATIFFSFLVPLATQATRLLLKPNSLTWTVVLTWRANAGCGQQSNKAKKKKHK